MSMRFSKRRFRDVAALSAGCGVAAAFVTLCVVGCTTTPVTQRRSLALVPASQMQQLGVEAYAQMKAETHESDDGLLKARVVAVGQRIARASGADLQWEFTLFEDDGTINAFCLPGGKIGVYTGILPVARTDAGLAAILGHEVAHATAHHAQERVSQQLLSEAGMGVVSLTLGDGAFRQPLMAALGLGFQVGVLLPYSRKHETEADVIGLNYMARAGYDPSEAVALWERMAELEKGRPPEFLATHPNPENRAQALRERLDEVMPLYASSEKQASGVLR